MELDHLDSSRLIAGLAQAAPFRFVDRVCWLDETRVVTELHDVAMPQRFIDPAQVDTWAVLECAAQSSGLVLRGRKQAGGRGVIAAFRGVRREADLRLPLRLESHLVSGRWTLFDFDFQVYCGAQRALVGSIGIVIGR